MFADNTVREELIYVRRILHALFAFQDADAVFDKEAQAKDKRPRVSVNWPQAVLRVRFEDEGFEEQVEMEEANEGERL